MGTGYTVMHKVGEGVEEPLSFPTLGEAVAYIVAEHGGNGEAIGLTVTKHLAIVRGGEVVEETEDTMKP